MLALFRIWKIFISIISSFIPVKKIRENKRRSWLRLFSKINFNSLEKNKKFENNLSALICVRNEAPYLREWIEYHRLLGIEKFYIYDNESTDDIMSVLEPYINQNIVVCKKWFGNGRQRKIYSDGIKECKNKTKWLAIIDIDEFIVPLKHKNIKDFLKDYKDFSQISIHWKSFGSSGHKKKPAGLVIENFNYAHKEINGAVKSIVNPRAVLGDPGIHASQVIGMSVDENKCPYYDDDFINGTFSGKYKYSADIISVNHYFTKSEEEFIEKRSRGRMDAGTGGDYTLEEFEKYNSFETVYDDSIKRFIPKLKERLGQ
jgi:hypothetical protein